MTTAAPCWFRLPPGFFPVDLDALDDWEERLSAATALLHADPPPAALRHLLESLPERGVAHAAFGLHSGDDGEWRVCLLTLSDVETRAPGPAAAAARCVLALAGADAGLVQERTPVRLTCGTPAALVTSLLPVPEAAGRPAVASGAFQARLAVARPSGSGVVLVELTTPATELAAPYTDILLGVGQTLAFTDPDAPRTPRTVARPSRLLDLM
ncbi:hypothetical protein [Streptomyces solicathayae]|uniref:Uncharacterized protein n=1 Tax=Streptomyces solicathayae TaxID=3081768 RepID=A0ABZ0LNF6_9ACTN|nr:hypothetical protein [Streptomyces sp. HUAS YS2]WOX21041.1 hypothetical protein R2D22_06425 [Streptomyces sp. HUAS YS2]